MFKYHLTNKLRFALTWFSTLFLREPTIPKKDSYKVISLGQGQQSTALYLMSSTGYVERADFAVFADPGSENKETYEYLKWLKKWAKQNGGIPIIHVGKKTLYKDLIAGTNKTGSRFASIPAFTKNENGKTGILQRQCTEEYKTSEVFKALRSVYRLKAKQRTPPTEIWLGITREEKDRLKYPRVKWMTFVYPFVNYKSTKSNFERVAYTNLLSRHDCVEWLTANSFPVPPKSACIFCPFQSDRRWLDLKTKHPGEWRKVIALDERIRNSTAKGVKQPIYLHRSCEPLKDANLQENQLDLFNAECSGLCGV